MATSDDLLSGSGAVLEHVCQPCRDDGETREAAGFCVDCDDWLCHDCYSVHTTPRPLRHHVLRDMKEMEQFTVEATVTGSEEVDGLEEDLSKLDINYSTIQARHVADIPARTADDYRTCVVRSSTLLPGKLVLTDDINEQVKVVDLETNKLLSDYNVDGSPWGVCKASDNSVVVTVCDKRKLLFLSVSAKGKVCMTKAISVDGQCVGVAVLDDKLVIGFCSPSQKIEIMDTSGNILKTIEGSKKVDHPQHIAIGPDRKSLYVSNYDMKAVTCVGLDGKLIATYKDWHLDAPEQLAIDGNGMLYLCDRHWDKLRLVTAECRKVKVLLEEKDGLDDVSAVSYCGRTHRLYIGSARADVIKVFKLE